MTEAILAIAIEDAPPRIKPSIYPPVFAARVAGRVKRPLGDLFRLKNFGVNYVTMAPGAISALNHRHAVQDEFVLVLSGTLTLVHDGGETELTAGMCAGFPAGGTAHNLENRSNEEASYIEVGDRTTGDEVEYPRDDLRAVMGEDRVWRFTRKDGTPY